jgi:hypothetical protein
MGTNFANYEDTFDAVVQKRSTYRDTAKEGDTTLQPHASRSV